MNNIGDVMIDSYYMKSIWIACVDCGKERWVRLNRGKPRNPRCLSCVGQCGEENSNWKGGRRVNEGYVYVYKPDHPRAHLNGYIKRAILILEEKLGRPLLKNEDSHHINGIKDDDRPENLLGMSRSKHMSLHNNLWKNR